MQMEDWRTVLGANVKRLRLAKGLTQEQLAHEADIDLTYLGGIERGRRNPSLLVMGRIAKVLAVTPAELITAV
jgi:transcriptional regulator with XRE-family HTH domain